MLMSPTIHDPILRRRLALGLISAPVNRNRRRRLLDRIRNSDAFDRMRCHLILHEFECMIFLLGLISLCVLAAGCLIATL